MSKKMGHASSEEVLPNLVRTVTANGSAVDIQQYSEDVMFTLMSIALTGTTPTLDVKIQGSADGSTGWADISGATFTQVTDAADAHESIVVDSDAAPRYIRAVATIAGTTPSGCFGVSMAGFKQVL